MFIACPHSPDGPSRQQNLLPRHLGGADNQLSPDSRFGSADHPSQTAVLIPLVISMVLILLGIGTAILFYISYRKRHRIWLADFRIRREAERRRLEKEDKEGVDGPGWWEVEVGDGYEAETDGRWGGAYGDQDEKEEDMRWNVCPTKNIRAVDGKALTKSTLACCRDLSS